MHLITHCTILHVSSPVLREPHREDAHEPPPPWILIKKQKVTLLGRRTWARLPIAEKEPTGVTRRWIRRCRSRRRSRRDQAQPRPLLPGHARRRLAGQTRAAWRCGDWATACGRDDGASTPCARPGGPRPIGVCASACVGDKAERERII
jgi:hypothetical protein